MDNNSVTNLSDNDVTAHTAAMWKYNPVHESPEPYPEFAAKSACEGGLEITAASVRGKKHKHDGSNCDDGFAFAFVDGTAIAAVADGAGSKHFSRIGARATCEAVVKYVRTRLSAIKRDAPNYREILGMAMDSAPFGSMCMQIAGMLRDSYAEAYAAVEAAYEKRRTYPEFIEAAGREPKLSDFSCTLLAAAVIPVDTENGREYLTAAIQLGDGMIAAMDDTSDSPLVILGMADSGGFSGETEFLTSEKMRSDESLMSRTKIRRGRTSRLMLMTDGVADDYYPANPQMIRLAADLAMNGIISIEQAEERDVEVPAPVEYPWVNDGDVKYALQYAKNLLSAFEMTPEQLWRDKGLMKKASLESMGIVHDRDRAEALKIWLDNYVERGSFDDRTLLIVTMEN